MKQSKIIDTTKMYQDCPPKDGRVDGDDDDKKEIDRLTKELNTLKLAHETTLEDH